MKTDDRDFAAARPDDPDHLPSHVTDSVRSVAALNVNHRSRANPLQITVERIIDVLGKPSASFIVTLSIVGWLSINIALPILGVDPIDRAPFSYLQTAVSIAALLTTLLVLASQRHENKLAEERAQLTLQLSISTDQKVAKLIELVEHQRRDNPQLADRIDSAAAEMSRSTDPSALIDAIAKHGETLQADRRRSDS